MKKPKGTRTEQLSAALDSAERLGGPDAALAVRAMLKADGLAQELRAMLDARDELVVDAERDPVAAAGLYASMRS